MKDKMINGELHTYSIIAHGYIPVKSIDYMRSVDCEYFGDEFENSSYSLYALNDGIEYKTFFAVEL